ncbi:hypothetical protein [Brevibacillus brevis]|uniref:hypothetical protein n=1 Tax=Brevibacillus brevis TaxID=1393 RepID=UPI000D0F7F82|nr:hypothetical protein [Brevibacillus brevis]PSJ71131.1 hypothetical protein C7J99_00995 [Brevibacillus brevis]RED28730.1 hypothetical protein DES34_10779 [Brevibacillus brevis]GEC89734.1 hypothetical protein BBR01nite_20650 [Brevibacillus brevis]VEF91675.1 Uncharacterised protein [Brevibacillus brevis]
MKKFAWLGTALLVLLLMGCSSSSPDAVLGLGKEEAAQIAAAAVRQYYQVDVDTTDREITLEDPTNSVYRGVPVHAILKREPVSGDVHGFHAIIEPKSKQILSLSIDVIGINGEMATKTMTEAALEKTASDFIRSKNLLATNDFQLVKASDAHSNDAKRYFYYTDGLNDVAIGVDPGLQQVVTFTYD